MFETTGHSDCDTDSDFYIGNEDDGHNVDEELDLEEDDKDNHVINDHDPLSAFVPLPVWTLICFSCLWMVVYIVCFYGNKRVT